MSRLKLFERVIILSNVVISILFVSLLIIGKYPKWWEGVIFERSPMTWFESILLFSCLLLSVGCLLFSVLKEYNSKTKLWALMVIGFGYLTLDERFAIHERLRDGFLGPKGIKLPIFFWTSAGDFILLVFLVIGLLLLPKVLKLFKQRKTSLICFITGICFSAIAILMDSYNFEEMSVQVLRIEQFVEELLETTGMLFFVNSLFLLFTDYVKKYIE